MSTTNGTTMSSLFVIIIIFLNLQLSNKIAFLYEASIYKNNSQQSSNQSKLPIVDILYKAFYQTLPGHIH